MIAVRTPTLFDIEGAYNVKSYGATGNGTTDDTVAIQATINAAGTAGGGDVLFPAGIYKVSQQASNAYCLLVPYSGITLRGHGLGTRIACATATVDTILFQSGPTTYATATDHGRLVDLWFNPSVAKGNTYVEVRITWTRAFYIDRLIFGQPDHMTSGAAPTVASNIGGCMAIGLAAAGQSANIEISNIRAFGYYQLLNLVSTVDVDMAQWETDASRVNASPLSFGNAVEAIKAVNCDFVNSAGVDGRQGTNYANMVGAVLTITGTTRFSTFTNCFFDTNALGLDAGFGSANHFVNCWFSCRPNQGAKVYGSANGYHFVGCQFTNCGADGIQLNAGHAHCISACEFAADSQTTASPCITVGASCTGARIVGNWTGRSEFGLTGTGATFGLAIANGATYITAIGNDFHLAGGISNGSADSTVIVANNN